MYINQSQSKILLNLIYFFLINVFFFSHLLWHKVTRKDSLRRLTDLHCEEIKNQRLVDYQKDLEAEQPGFLEEKIKILEFIRKEQESCGVPLTVEQKEIDETKLQLENLLKSQQKVEAE